MSKNPLISVIMPAYNVEAFIGEAIDSILNQTLSDFELIVINDGSTDKTLQIVTDYAKKDNRIVIISRENRGIVNSRNEGVQKSKGKYIAKMDADDISFPERFEQQIKFLESNNLDICGTAIRRFSDKGNLRVQYYPSNDKDIKFLLLFINAFAHSTVMIKSSVFQELSYRSDMHTDDISHTEDYQLWIDMALKGFKMGNINQVLVKYRVHDNQVSAICDSDQIVANVGFTYLSVISKEITHSLSLFLKKSNVATWNELCKQLMAYKVQHKINDLYFVEVLRHLLRGALKTSLVHFLVYKKWTKNINKDLTGKVYMFIQCFLFLNKKSKLYQFLKKIYLRL